MYLFIIILSSYPHILARIFVLIVTPFLKKKEEEEEEEKKEEK